MAEAYDVGGIVRATQEEFRLFRVRTRFGLESATTNRATPENLALLLHALDDFTDDLVEWHNDSVVNLDWRQRFLVDGDEETLERIEDDLEAWQRRLDEYIFAVSEAAPNDRQAVLWNVTAPLLLGFYGGEGSTLGRGVADVATPFRIANALLVSDEFQRRSFEQWQDDFADALMGGTIVDAVGAGIDAAGDAANAAGDFFDTLGTIAKYAIPAGLLVWLVRGRR
jgi:hypothetical protein